MKATTTITFGRTEEGHTGMNLDVSAGRLTDDTPIIQWPPHGGENQSWQLVTNNDGTVRLQNKLSGKVLDAQDGGSIDGTPLVQRTWNGGAGQRWTLTQV